MVSAEGVWHTRGVDEVLVVEVVKVAVVVIVVEDVVEGCVVVVVSHEIPGNKGTKPDGHAVGERSL